MLKSANFIASASNAKASTDETRSISNHYKGYSKLLIWNLFRSIAYIYMYDIELSETRNVEFMLSLGREKTIFSIWFKTKNCLTKATVIVGSIDQKPGVIVLVEFYIDKHHCIDIWWLQKLSQCQLSNAVVKNSQSWINASAPRLCSIEVSQVIGVRRCKTKFSNAGFIKRSCWLHCDKNN